MAATAVMAAAGPDTPRMATTTPAANEAALREAFLPVRDPHERLALITDACAGRGLPAGSRHESDLVLGCVSKVWLCSAVVDGVIHLSWDAASPLVRGLAGLICQVYQNTAAAEIPTHRATLLTELGLDRQLSPTRLRGLAAVEGRIHQLAGSVTWKAARVF